MDRAGDIPARFPPSERPAVSGMNFQTMRIWGSRMQAKMRKVPEGPTPSRSDGVNWPTNVSVSHIVRIAIDIACERMLVGKISEAKMNLMGPSEKAKKATKAHISAIRTWFAPVLKVMLIPTRQAMAPTVPICSNMRRPSLST